MRDAGQPLSRRVHRGTTGLCIELRKHPSVVADLVLTKGKMEKKEWKKGTRTDYGGCVFCHLCLCLDYASRLKTVSWPPITLTRGFGLDAAKTEELFPIG